MRKIGSTRFPRHVRAIFQLLYPDAWRMGAINCLPSGDIVATARYADRVLQFCDKRS